MRTWKSVLLWAAAAGATAWALHATSYTFWWWALAWVVFVTATYEIRRRSIAAFIVGLGLCWFVYQWSHAEGHAAWGWGVGVFAMGSTFVTVLQSRRCPWCKGRCNVDKGGFDNCVNCTKPVGSLAGRYVRVYEAPLSDESRFPDSCSACGAPATRHEDVHGKQANVLGSVASTAFGWATGGIGVSAKYTEACLSMPFCDEHVAGVFLQVDPPALFYANEDCRAAFCSHNGIVTTT